MPLEKSCFVLGITSSGVLSGLLFGISAATIPALLAAPSGSEKIILGQWDKLYSIVSKTAAAVALTAVSCHFTNAYNVYHRDVPRRSYKFVAASLCILSIIPATEIFIRPTINALFKKNSEAGNVPVSDTSGFGRYDGDDAGADSAKTMELVERLGKLNWIRVVLATASMLIAFDTL